MYFEDKPNLLDLVADKAIIIKEVDKLLLLLTECFKEI